MENQKQQLDRIEKMLTAFLSQQQPDVFIDIKKASTVLNMTVGTVYQMVHKRQIPYYKRGKKLQFKQSELLKYINSGRKSDIQELEQMAEDRNTL